MSLKLSEKEIENVIKEVNFDKMGGLVPVVVQDISKRKVLMQAFMNREALKLTFQTGLMHYWSRTRGKIWLKGESSGNYSIVKNAILDCDGDAILFHVHQVGPCCHTGKYSCFHNPILPLSESEVDGRVLDEAFEVLKKRIENPPEGSGLSRLAFMSEGEALIELRSELSRAVHASFSGDEEALIGSSAKLILNLLYLLVKNEVSLSRVLEKLKGWNVTSKLR